MNAKEIMAIGLLIFGSLIVAFAVWVEPSGELHASVLTFYGETLTGILLLLGIPIPKKNNKPCKTNRKQNSPTNRVCRSSLPL